MRRLAGHAEQWRLAVRLGPYRAAGSFAMVDPMADATQWQECSVRKRHGVRQPPQPCRDPRTVFLRKFSRLLHAAARRHRKHDIAASGVDAQRIAPRLSVAAKAHQIDLSVERDRYGFRLAGAAKKQGAQGTGHLPPRIRGCRQCAIFARERARSMLGGDLQRWGAHRAGAVTRKHKIGDTRRDLCAEARAVEDAVVTNVWLQVVHLVFVRNIDAKRVRSLGLAYA